ncbi:MAG: hypothetical protein COW16_09165 [Sphingomonadales bacterium CG12_big_fil_rev_8_21_14_0_65_65_10]|jgi:F-type H+-transporting ATPase subunit b|uniref:F0F1 ATP synthase subunit B family protein n=1 Tax=Blastomonas marina TaxID=1867408 RepID=UPI000CBA6E9A|nr:hypothetical protein [Blastomonas marina]PIW54862.1 MAG: hypothetical protein COW16_09165 [Sphingomonadales bacterium CG12_big_fil_rev_8_21_14_0_65_65_10]WPZ04511.1 hypothetical protein T8S45_02940 [Blastomonas marina]
MANTPAPLTTGAPEAHTEVDASGATHESPSLWGFEPYQWVSVAMLVLLAFAFIGAKVHRTIAGGLDKKIADIREQLDEAKELRAEAEALRNEYAAKIANAEKDAEAMIESAKGEAEGIVAKAEADSKAIVERRKRMAEDRIAAAERDALEEVRNRAVTAATAAAGTLIDDKFDADADRALADKVIADI